MQKKIVAAICAAALALAMPVAAFATPDWAQSSTTDATVSGSMVTIDLVDDVEGDLATMSDFVAKGSADIVKYVKVNATNSSAVAVDGSNVIAAQSFAVNFTDKDQKAVVGLIGTKYQTFSGKIDFKQKAFTNLGTGVAFDNLYEQIYFTPSNGVNAGNFMLIGGPQKVDVNGTASDVTVSSAVSSFATDSAASGTITAVITNGRQVVNPGLVSGTDRIDDVNKAAADSSKSPKTGEVA